jgi:hypothetical protein
MAEVDRLLRAYVERFEETGFADPREFLSQLERDERRELAALIEGYLEHAAPTQAWDPQAFEGSLAERAVSRAAEDSSAEIAGQDLVDLRNKRKLPRGKLVSRLAEALGVAPQREKVALYYHQMENGLLPVAGISRRVFDALAGLLGTSAGAVRKAASTPHTAEEATTYARLARSAPLEVESADALDSTLPAVPEEDWDEVDGLFLGG